MSMAGAPLGTHRLTPALIRVVKVTTINHRHFLVGHQLPPILIRAVLLRPSCLRVEVGHPWRLAPVHLDTQFLGSAGISGSLRILFHGLKPSASRA